MRPPIPIENQCEIFALIKEKLPGIDSSLVDELTADYLLESLIGINCDDLNHVLIRPGLFLSGASKISSVPDFMNAAEQLLTKLLEQRLTNMAPSGFLITVRSYTGLQFNHVGKLITRMKELLPEETECFFGCFYDPDGTEAKIRIYLTGEANIRETPESEAPFDRHEDIPSFLIKY